MERPIRRAGRPGRPGRDRRRQSALAVTVLVTGALFLTSFDLHPHPELPALIEGDLPVYSGAAHPGEAPHAEAAGRASIQRCAACLLQLHSQAENTPRPFSAAVASPAGLARVASTHGLGAPEYQPGGSRAPPTV